MFGDAALSNHGFICESQMMSMAMMGTMERTAVAQETLPETHCTTTST